jgi:hypothetical protein
LRYGYFLTVVLYTQCFLYICIVNCYTLETQELGPNMNGTCFFPWFHIFFYFMIFLRSLICPIYLAMSINRKGNLALKLKKFDWTLFNWQCRYTGNIGYTRHRIKTKQKTQHIKVKRGTTQTVPPNEHGFSRKVIRPCFLICYSRACAHYSDFLGRV